MTIEASTKGLGATLWQEQANGNSKPIGFVSRFLSDTEKICNKRDRIISRSLRLENFRLYNNGSDFLSDGKKDKIADGSSSVRTVEKTEQINQNI